MALRKRPCAKLKHLDLKESAIGNAGCAHLARAFERRACPELTHLDLFLNGIGTDGCAQLLRGLAGCPGLQQLLLWNNAIDALPPELFGLVLKLNKFRVDDAALGHGPMRTAYRHGLAAFKGYLRRRPR